MEAERKTRQLIDELRESLDFLEKLLNSGSRLELIVEHVEEVMETIKTMLLESELQEDARIALDSLHVRAKNIAAKVRDMVVAQERETRNLKTRSRAWE